MDAVRGQDWAAYDRIVDGVISRLRRKLFPNGTGRQRIKTIRGQGYMLSTQC
jgi:DNA-binding response OmpR family regulator